MLSPARSRSTSGSCTTARWRFPEGPGKRGKRALATLYIIVLLVGTSFIGISCYTLLVGALLVSPPLICYLSICVYIYIYIYT